MSLIGAGTMLGIYAIPVVALCVQPTYVLRFGAWYHVLCYALHSQRDPYSLDLTFGGPSGSSTKGRIPQPSPSGLYTVY